MVSAFSSCTINKDIMFKTPVDYVYDEAPDVDSLDYRIARNDRVRFSLFTNDGYMLIDIASQGANGNSGNSNAQAIRQFGLNYLVERDGTAKLPTLGKVELVGLTVVEAETKLEGLYAQFYRKPFVQLAVVNNRVIVSPGYGGAAQVVSIVDNMTVMEVLADAGGVASRGNASKIKLIRDNGGKKEVYLLDLSTIQGIEDADLIVQDNDIIYVEPNPEIAREVLRDITPILTLITSTVALIAILTR